MSTIVDEFVSFLRMYRKLRRLNVNERVIRHLTQKRFKASRIPCAPYTYTTGNSHSLRYSRPNSAFASLSFPQLIVAGSN